MTRAADGRHNARRAYLATAASSLAPGTTFHPTFAYEALWNLVGVGVLLLVDRRWRIRPPALFSLYVACGSWARGQSWLVWLA